MAREASCMVSEPESSSTPRVAAGGAKPKKKPAVLDETTSSSSCRVAGRKRKSDEAEDERRRASKVAYIFCGEGGERDLMAHLQRSSRVQILSTESLPDIDASDLIHGLDPSGTSR